MIHLRNNHAPRLSHVRGEGQTWCGKKLLGNPERVDDNGVMVFVSYGDERRVTEDPASSTCPQCRQAFNAAYAAAFPEGPKPIATFKLDNPADMDRARAVLSPEALTRFFSPGGGGMPAFMAAIETGTPA